MMPPSLFEAATPEELLHLFRLAGRTLWRAWDKTQNPDLWLAWEKVLQVCHLIHQCETNLKLH